MQGVSVEAVDPVFQAKMLDMLKQTGRLGFSLLTIKYVIITAKSSWFPILSFTTV